jgi:hypothetical protein
VKAQAKFRTLGSSGLGSRLAKIVTVMGMVGIVALLLFSFMDWGGLAMIAVAWVICLVASLVAHVVGDLNSSADDFAIRLALGMAARTVPPFLLVLVARLSPAVPFESGFVFSVILFYLVGLFVDVSLHVARLKMAE